MEKLDILKQRIDKFNKDRDWDQFHTPVNLAKSISIEAAELLEKHFNDKPTVLFPYGVSNICILRLSTFNSMFGELK